MIVMATFLLLAVMAYVTMCILMNIGLIEAWNPRIFIERARRLPPRLQDWFWLVLTAEAAFSVAGFMAVVSLLGQQR